MIPNVTRGAKTVGVLRYLVGMGKREEHEHGLEARPRYAEGGTSEVVGYSVRLASGEHDRGRVGPATRQAPERPVDAVDVDAVKRLSIRPAGAVRGNAEIRTTGALSERVIDVIECYRS